MNNASLIQEAKAGSTAAQKCLFDLLAPKMLVVCRRYLRTKEDAEECMTDGFVKFFRAITRFAYRDDPSLVAWVKKIMVNECLVRLRKTNSFNIVSESAAGEFPATDDAISNLSATEIFNLIILLPVGYRTVFNLFAVEGFDHQEIAAMLGIAEGTSKSQLSKARILLQKILIQKGIKYEPGKSSRYKK